MLLRCGFIPYEGKEPYIFISYAHRDAEIVFPVIEQLNQMGYRIWYDDGIAPGSEWPEDIANHLNQCALVIAFITPNSLASDNCRREITYSLAKKKPFLAVILQPVVMSPGMEMQLSAQQCVLKYSYQTEEAFFRKLCSCQGLACCRREPVYEPAAVKPAPVAAPPQVPVQQQRPEPVIVQEPVQPVTQGPVPVQKKAPITKKKKLLLFGGIGAACLVLVLVLLAGGIFSGTGLRKIQIAEGNTVSVNETYLSLYDQTITADTAANIAQLTKLESLHFQNCSFAEGALERLSPLTTLTTLAISDCTGVTDLSFLENQQNLSSLTLKNVDLTDAVFPVLSAESLRDVNLAGNKNWKDLSKLQNCTGLRILDISGTGVESLDPLKTLSITKLDFSDTKVTTVTALGQMENLSVVYGANTKVTNIDALAPLTTLSEIDFSGCRLGLVYPKFQSLRLWGLNLANTGMTNLSAFENLTVLRQVDVHGNGIWNLDFLAKSAATLKYVDISGNYISAEELAFLADSPELLELRMDGISGENLDFLKNCTKLEELSAANCGLTDISALSACPSLKEINLAGNGITDISPLKNLQTKWLRLDLSFNPLEDVSDLPKVSYKLLFLLCEDLDPATIPQVEGNFTAVYYTQSMLELFMSKKTFSTYAVMDCPADRQVALEDTVGRHRLQLVASEEELVAFMKKQGISCDYLLN